MLTTSKCTMSGTQYIHRVVQPPHQSVLEFYHPQKKLHFTGSHSSFSSPHNPCQPLIFLVIQICLFWTFHMNGIMPCDLLQPIFFTQYMYWSVDRHFHFYDLFYNATVNASVQVFMWIYISLLLGIYTGAGLLWLTFEVLPNFSRVSAVLHPTSSA